MRTKGKILLIGVGVLTMVLITGHRPVAAVPPAGEVKTVAALVRK
jgi:hypothetical protein